METEQRPRTWVTCLVSALATFVVVEPALLWAQSNNESLPYEESTMYLGLLVLTFLVIPCIIGIVVSRRHTDYPLRTSALATLCSTGLLMLFGIARKLISDNHVPLEYVIKYVVYLQFTIAISVIAAYFAMRVRATRSPTNSREPNLPAH